MASHAFVNTRGEKRINLGLPATLRVGCRGGWVADASAVDLSERGLRLRTDFELELGQCVEAMVNEGMSDRKSYRVVWVRESDAGYSGFEAGLEMLAHIETAGEA